MKDARGPWHLNATLLPDGEVPIDLWVEDGRLSFEPQPGARELVPPGAFVATGLVDAHTHLAFSDERGAEVLSRAQINDRRRAHLQAGTTFLRDMGGTSPAAVGLPQDDGLPRSQAAGRCLIFEDRFPFTPTPPAGLVDAALEQVASGADWVKIFVDWPGWPDDDGEPQFGTDHLSYGRRELSDATQAVRDAGARVAVHAFGFDGARVAVEAGVDSLEHGWGLTDDLLVRMASCGMGWVPLLGIASMMLSGAEQRGDAAQADWIRERRLALATLLPRARQLGVPILAGTDWFPDVRLIDEVKALVAAGLEPATALAAASTGAKRFFGELGLESGAPADLVVFRTDPRLDLDALANPEVVLLGGQRVEGT